MALKDLLSAKTFTKPLVWLSLFTYSSALAASPLQKLPSREPVVTAPATAPGLMPELVMLPGLRPLPSDLSEPAAGPAPDEDVVQRFLRMKDHLEGRQGKAARRHKKREAEQALILGALTGKRQSGPFTRPAGGDVNHLEVVPLVSERARGLTLLAGVPGAATVDLGERLTAYSSSATSWSYSDSDATAGRPFLVLLQGGLHGNEELGRLLVASLALRFQRGVGRLAQVAKKHGVGFDFLPVANPQGGILNQRQNAYGVDLNRNFPVLWGALGDHIGLPGSSDYPGRSALSEAESLAVSSLLKSRRYDLAFDLHGYADLIVTPSTPETLTAHGLSVAATEASRYRAWTALLSERVGALLSPRREPGLVREVQASSALGHGGAFEDFAFWRLGTLAACIEISSLDDDAWERDRARIVRRYEDFIASSIEAALPLQRGRGRVGKVDKAEPGVSVSGGTGGAGFGVASRVRERPDR